MSRCRKSSVTETGEGWEQANLGGFTSCSCWHIQTPACLPPSASLVLPKDMQILLLMLSPASSPPYFLHSTSAPSGTSVCFSSARLSSTHMPSFLALLNQSCHHFSNMLTWAGCCCCFSLCSWPFSLPRIKKRATEITWGRDKQCAHHCQSAPPVSNSSQTSTRGMFWRNIPHWAGKEQEKHYSLSSLLEMAVLVHSVLFTLTYQAFQPPAPTGLICNGIAKIWRLVWNHSL